METVEQKNDTLFGGRSITVTFEDGTQTAVKVKQLRLSEYEAAFLKYDNEFALAGLICGQDEKWIQSLMPESYEAVLQAAQEVNEKGFFVYAARRHGNLIKRLNSITPQILQAAQSAIGTSSNSSQRQRPRPA